MGISVSVMIISEVVIIMSLEWNLTKNVEAIVRNFEFSLTMNSPW